MIRFLWVAAPLVLCESACLRDGAGQTGGAEGTAAGPARGSLVAVPAGAVEESYAYDGAGNLTEVRAPQAVAALSLTDFTPKRAAFGEIVAAAGTGFSPIPAANRVLLAGAAVEVVAASATRLSFRVPSGAASGRISVSVAGDTVTSVDDLAVLPPVVVSDFTPRMGKPGTSVTIAGANFDPDPAGDRVSVGAGSATVTAATAGSLTITLDATARTGKISVVTGSGAGSSPGDFIVVPPTLAEESVGATGQLPAGGPATLTITDPGKVGLLVFDGVQGQYRSLFVSINGIAGTTKLTVYDPSASTLFTGSAASGQPLKFALPVLPTTGTYLVAVEPPAAGAGAITVQVFQDVVLGLDPFAGVVHMSLAAGQNGRLVFTGRPGDYLGLGYSGFSVSPSGANVALAAYRPDGSALGSTTASAAGSWQLPQFSTAGPMAVTVRPFGVASASLDLLLSLPLTGKLSPSTATRFQSARAGQSGRYTFSASAGQSFTLRATAGTGFSGSVPVTVYQPNGASIGTGSVSSGGSIKVDLSTLPASGKYTVVVAPPGAGVGTIDLTVIPQATDELIVGDPAKVVTLLAGQNGRYTFTGSAGGLLSLSLSALTTVPATTSVALRVLRPDGTSLWSTATTKAGTWSLPQLTLSGTHVLLIQPAGTASLTAQAQLLTR